MKSANPDLVRTRVFEPNSEQRSFVEYAIAETRTICETPEDATAVLALALSEFILRVAKPENVPEAVETAIRCLRLNTGVEKCE